MWKQIPKNFSQNSKRSFSTRSEFAISHLSQGISRMTDLEMEIGKGCWVTTTDGKKYLDFTCGIAVTNTGHCHPKVVKAAQEQTAKLIHGQVNIFIHKPMVDLIERLKSITPKPLDRYFFWNSGAEAIEASIKLARHATKKSNIIVFQGSFHGRTIGTMSLTTSKTIYRAGFGPLMPGVFVAPFPYCHHCSIPRTEGECCNNPIQQIEIMLKQQTAPNETAAILIEPILGEGGYVVPPKGFLKSVKEICQKNGILMIADEVQTGYGRTGKWFSIEHFDVTPDILVFSKGIASGFPLSCIASTTDLMKTQPAGSMGGTFAGNAVSCAAACATIDVIKEENLLQNAVVRGQQLKSGLLKLKEKYDVISDIRGLGLMIGLEFKGSSSIWYCKRY